MMRAIIIFIAFNSSDTVNQAHAVLGWKSPVEYKSFCDNNNHTKA
jgi:hypothetical protein